MRINKYLAVCLGISRRKADELLSYSRVTINNKIAAVGDQVFDNDVVRLDNKEIERPADHTTIILNKPIGHVCSRDGQGSNTIYDLLPVELHKLKPVGRLDKDSSGLLLMTDDGDLAHRMSHPSFEKEKVYQVELNRKLSATDKERIESGVNLGDGLSRLKLDGSGRNWTVTMHEGRNRQIRRTFEYLHYNVVKLHRTRFGQYSLSNLAIAKYSIL